VLYEAATGHRPFGDGGDTWSCPVWRGRLQLERAALPAARAAGHRRCGRDGGCPWRAAAAIDACLHRDPAQRPTLAALDAALAQLLV
jgi:hypothetical protein